MGENSEIEAVKHWSVQALPRRNPTRAGHLGFAVLQQCSLKSYFQAILIFK